MPHLCLEYTANVPQKIDFDTLFSELHHTLSDVGRIDIGNCKGRAVRLENYYVADGKADVAFVHLEVRLFAGRPDELKQQIAAALMNVLKAHFAQTGAGPAVQFSLEMRDVHQPTYLKAV
jgi:5-carboxymethyl-2-hydroxymuconate isomerase